MRWIKLDLTYTCLKKLLIVALNLHYPQLNRTREFSSFFRPVRFMSVQPTSSPPFPLPAVASPPVDVGTPPRHVTLPSHGVKTTSLPPLHPVVSPLESKSKHWIHTTVIGHPPWTTRLPPSTVIKRSSQSWLFSPSLNTTGTRGTSIGDRL
jgi:hypothetical protein